MDENSRYEEIADRCAATVARLLAGQCADSAVAEAVSSITGLPPRFPRRSPLAAQLIVALVRQGPTTAFASLRHLEELLPVADVDPPDDRQWPPMRASARALRLMYAAAQGRLADRATVDAELAELAETAKDWPALRGLLDSTQMALGVARAIAEGQESTLQRLPAEMSAYFERMGEAPGLDAHKRVLDRSARALAANQRGDRAEMWAQFELLQEEGQHLPQDTQLREVLAETAARVRPYRDLFTDGGTGRGPASPDDAASPEAGPTDRHGATDYDRAIDHLAWGGALLRGGQETDPARIEAGLEHFRAALRLTPADHPQLSFARLSLALGLFRRSEVTGTTEGLDEAAGLLECARDLLGGPHHPQWVLANEMLAGIRQRTGYLQESGDLGLAAQRGYAWRVLLESDAAGAKAAIRDAAEEAVDLARRCLAANNPEEALSALDAGRGLMLFAAAELHNIPASLELAGHPELARSWLAAGKDSSELRREALTVLAGQGGAADSLLNPPTVAEIQSALAALDADALVYLVAGKPPLPGLAVIADVAGPPAYMALPGLRIDGEVDIERYLSALADRSRDVGGAADPGQFAGRLADLCDWAWRAAIGPLLERYFATRPGESADREPRIVLIPMGDLARIPWSAARRADGVYAVQLAALSNAVSARLLCQNAELAPIAASPAGLVVGDPDTGGAAISLDAARIEADAIRKSFYPGARYVGRRPNGTVSPSGPGTAKQVRRWLVSREPAAGAMLHLACHGAFAAGPREARSYLLLAADEPTGSGAGELSAEELVTLLQGASDRQLGLVVLAACNTGRSIHGYDEAYSLGSAFLAGGARSVLSTQWSIPDAATSALMFLFHHYLRRVGLPPWQALRRAQIWMLDAHRQAPEGMPERPPSLPDHAYADVVSWAGFVHYGQ